MLDHGAAGAENYNYGTEFVGRKHGRNKMFKWLKSKPSEKETYAGDFSISEIFAAKKELRKLIRYVEKSGGPFKICMEYLKFIQSDTLYQKLGIVVEDDAPCSKLIAMLCALGLIDIADKSTDDSEEIRESFYNLSLHVYVAANLSIERDEILPMFKESGGDIEGEIDINKITDAMRIMESDIKYKREKAIEAWKSFRQNPITIF